MSKSVFFFSLSVFVLANPHGKAQLTLDPTIQSDAAGDLRLVVGKGRDVKFDIGGDVVSSIGGITEDFAKVRRAAQCDQETTKDVSKVMAETLEKLGGMITTSQVNGLFYGSQPATPNMGCAVRVQPRPAIDSTRVYNRACITLPICPLPILLTHSVVL